MVSEHSVLGSVVRAREYLPPHLRRQSTEFSIPWPQYYSDPHPHPTPQSPTARYNAQDNPPHTSYPQWNFSLHPHHYPYSQSPFNTLPQYYEPPSLPTYYNRSPPEDNTNNNTPHLYTTSALFSSSQLPVRCNVQFLRAEASLEGLNHVDEELASIAHTLQQVSEQLQWMIDWDDVVESNPLDHQNCLTISTPSSCTPNVRGNSQAIVPSKTSDSTCPQSARWKAQLTSARDTSTTRLQPARWNAQPVQRQQIISTVPLSELQQPIHQGNVPKNGATLHASQVAEDGLKLSKAAPSSEASKHLSGTSDSIP